MVDGYQGGSAAKPGPDKNYVKPMGEGYDPGDVDEKLEPSRNYSQERKRRARDRLLLRASQKREKMKKEGFEIEEESTLGQKSQVRTLQVV